MEIAIIVASESGLSIARRIREEWTETEIYFKGDAEDVRPIHSIRETAGALFRTADVLLFVGAMGICIRSIAPYIKDKHTDPAVIVIDSSGSYAVSVLSGHIGGANEWTHRIARLFGAEAVITTQSDQSGLWALDTLGKTYGWVTRTTEKNLNAGITAFVNKHPTALLLDVREDGTRFLERTKPEHVDLYDHYEDIDSSKYELLLAVTPFLYPDFGKPVVYYHPKVLHLGVGCRKDCRPEGVAGSIARILTTHRIATDSIRDLSTIELKKDERLMKELQQSFGDLPLNVYQADELKAIELPNPSEKVKEVTSVAGVAEPAAIKGAGYGPLILEKQKGGLSKGNEFTFALAIDRRATRKGHIEIVGAGPGDPELISVKGRYFLEAADLILYAGSLVPVELTGCAKQGATVRSSASMTLEEQFRLMKDFYDRGLLVVRLHTGDPCIYGAIQEQMAFFDAHGMDYHITPGISSFQAAAAALRSQFTIPEKVQTIILTRGEGRTSMPEKEKLHLLARSQSTMCIFLSAAIADEVQQELSECYPPDTPVAVCYKLTWKEERIYRGKLRELSRIVKDHHLTLTTMIVVGEAIDNREGLSRLYSSQFSHLFRP